MAIHDRHDFHAFSTLRSSDFQPAALGHNEGCVDEAFFFVQCTSIAKLVSNIRQHAQRPIREQRFRPNSYLSLFTRLSALPTRSAPISLAHLT